MEDKLVQICLAVPRDNDLYRTYFPVEKSSVDFVKQIVLAGCLNKNFPYILLNDSEVLYSPRFEDSLEIRAPTIGLAKRVFEDLSKIKEYIFRVKI